MNAMEIYIQQQTGYLPKKAQPITKDPRYEIKRLIREPDAWKWLYSENICDTIYSWGIPKEFFWNFWKRNHPWLTHEELMFLEDNNPALWCIWTSCDSVIQFLSDETRDRLEPEIQSLCLLVETSTSRQDFETRYKRSIGLNQREFLNV